VPLPILFDQITVTHRSKNYSLEVNRQWRLRSDRYGGSVDVFMGPRYLSFDDQFMVDAIGGVLADSYWNARAENHVVGGQFGFRVNRKRGRLTLSTEGRFFAGGNAQTVRLDGQIGSRLNQTVQNPAFAAGTNTIPNGGGTDEGGTTSTTPAASTYTQSFTTVQANNPGRGTSSYRVNQPFNLNRTAFTSSRNFGSFVPLGELRFKAQYQVFDSLNVNAGWTGTYMDGLMRANNMIEYTLPAMAVSDTQRLQDVIINGFTMGIELNR